MQSNLKLDELHSKTPMKIGNYMLSDRICNNEPWKFAENHVGFNYKNYPTNKYNIDGESKLFGLDQKLNRYPTFLDTKISEISIDYPQPTSKTSVDDINIGINSRTSKSCQSYREHMPFTVLPDNVQNIKHIIFNEHQRGGINSRKI